MKDFYIKDLRKDTELTDFFMVKSSALRTGGNGKTFFDITLGDMTGEVSAKKWDVSNDEADILAKIKDGDIVKVKALVTEWNNTKQLRVARIRLSVSSDDLDLADYIKAAPEPSAEMYDYIYKQAEDMLDEDLRKLALRLLTDNKEKLMYYPAASKNHHAEFGGLLYHMKRMLMTGICVCGIYTNLNRDLIITGVIIHDMEKINEIESNEFGISPGYSFEGKMLGHIVQGIKTIDRLTLEMNFPREKAIMLEHMILSHHYEPEFGSPKKPLFPEAEMLHYLDIIDARMFDMEDALTAVLPGEFSERVFTLENRQLYKPVDADADTNAEKQGQVTMDLSVEI
ncbi:MAG: HD domain-containing protein [Firmicutes bacterium]|nr:HD domain-containing protein [Bacillota bacterium]